MQPVVISFSTCKRKIERPITINLAEDTDHAQLVTSALPCIIPIRDVQMMTSQLVNYCKARKAKGELFVYFEIL